MVVFSARLNAVLTTAGDPDSAMARDSVCRTFAAATGTTTTARTTTRSARCIPRMFAPCGVWIKTCRRGASGVTHVLLWQRNRELDWRRGDARPRHARA